MEQLNKVELIGVVGSVRTQQVADKTCIRLQMATNYAYKDRNGCPVIETTWHQVVAWEGRHVSEPKKGDNVKVVGRIHNQKYTTPTGEDKIMTEVYANKVEILDEQVLEMEV